MGKIIELDAARRQSLYRGLDRAEEATAALYEAAKELAKAGHRQRAQDYLTLCELSVELRSVLPGGTAA